MTEKQSCVVRFMEVTRLCRRVLYPSDSFEGALQKILFFHAMLWQMEHGHNGLGRLDMALFPYYKKDIEEGRLTREKAEVILREMIADASKKRYTLWRYRTIYPFGRFR